MTRDEWAGFWRNSPWVMMSTPGDPAQSVPGSVARHIIGEAILEMPPEELFLGLPGAIPPLPDFA